MEMNIAVLVFLSVLGRGDEDLPAINWETRGTTE